MPLAALKLKLRVPMRRLLILTLCAGFWACSKKASPSSEDFLDATPRAGHPAEQDGGSLGTRDITDRSACQGTALSDYSLPGRTWKLNYTFNNGATVDQYISFEEHFMVVENNCSWHHQTKTARVKVPIQLGTGEFEIQSRDSSQEIIQSDNEAFYCIADVPSDSVKFSFVGRCLSFNFSDRSILLAPADQ